MIELLVGFVRALAASAGAKAGDIGGRAVADVYDALRTLILRKLGKGGAVLPEAVSRPTIQVIGWKGIESAPKTEELSLAFLTTQMSLETLPTLEYFPHNSHKSLKFDVVYMDYEFVERYQELNIIEELASPSSGPGAVAGDTEIRNFFDFGNVAPAITNLITCGGNIRKMPISCMPVQFGFGEILLNPRGNLGIRLGCDKKTKENGSVWTHGDFNLVRLLKDQKTNVAIWHWYLPSLLQFLLSAANTGVFTLLEGLSMEGEKGEKYYNSLLVTHVNEVCGMLNDNSAFRRRVEVFSTMEGLRNALEGSFKAGVVLGQGSSVLAGPQQQKFAHILAIVPPKQGVLVWINCAAAIKTGNRAATTLINASVWGPAAFSLALYRRTRR